MLFRVLSNNSLESRNFRGFSIVLTLLLQYLLELLVTFAISLHQLRAAIIISKTDLVILCSGLHENEHIREVHAGERSLSTATKERKGGLVST